MLCFNSTGIQGNKLSDNNRYIIYLQFVMLSAKQDCDVHCAMMQYWCAINLIL